MTSEAEEVNMYDDDFDGDDDFVGEDEPMGSFDLSDDAWALASAGMGTDEDYGFFGYDDEY